MGKFEVRRLKTDDMPQLRELLSTRDDTNEIGPDKRLRMVEWLAFNNPLACGQASYFVVEDDGKLVAHIGRMPCQFYVGSQQTRGYYVHDLFVRPDYRSSGMGLFVSIALYEATNDESDSFCCLLWTSDLNLDIQRRFGYLEIHAGGFVKICRFEFLARKLGVPDIIMSALCFIPNLLLRVGDSLRIRFRRATCRIVPVERFDSRFDDFIERVRPRLGICSSKCSDVLNWKYIDSPRRFRNCFAAIDGDRVIGYVVLDITTDARDGTDTGRIIDIGFDPEDKITPSQLVGFAVSFFRKRGVETIRCVATQHRLTSILRSYWFLSRDSWKVPMMLGNLDKCPDLENALTDPRQWHMTRSESDGFMFVR